MDTWIIILAVVIIVIIFFLIKYYVFSTTTLATNIHLKNAPADISSNAITNPSSVLYTFGSWVYVNNFSNAILYSYVIGGSGGYNPASNIQYSLILGGATLGSTTVGKSNSPYLTAIISGKSGSTQAINTVTITHNFPIQKWVYVTVSVDTMYADCYLDGKLVISSPLTNQITNSPSQPPSITFTPPPNSGFTVNPDIYLTKLNRWDHPLDPQSVWNEYYAGNGLSQGGNLTVGLSVNSDNSSKNYTIYSNA
jgi:hypothetical protein